MTKQEVMKLLTLIGTIYPTFLTKDEAILLWFGCCQAMVYEKVMKRLLNHIKTSPYPPTLAEIAEFHSEDKECSREMETEIEGREDEPYRRPLKEWMSEYTLRQAEKLP